MSTRKRWRLRLYPSFSYQPEASMKKAYERMLSFQKDYATGHSNTHRVDIQVDERAGLGWQVFEICEFPERTEESA